MANITVGSDATIKSTTAEGQLHECCALLEIGEYNAAKNPNGADNIIGQHQQNQRLFSANFSIPLESKSDGEGRTFHEVAEYLSDFAFSPGSGGTFKSSNCAAYFVEVVVYIQNLEKDLTKNPGKIDNVSGRFDIDKGIFTGSINLPVTLSISTQGGVLYTADSYLL